MCNNCRMTRRRKIRKILIRKLGGAQTRRIKRRYRIHKRQSGRGLIQAIKDLFS